MKVKIVFILLSVFLLVESKGLFANLKLKDNINGGIGCAACTILVGLTEQLSIVYNTSIETSLYNFCNYLPPGLFRFTCQQAVDEYGAVIINGLDRKDTGDVVCTTLKFCRTDPGQPECRLFPKPPSGISLKQQTSNFENNLLSNNIKFPNSDPLASPCDEPIFKQICNFFLRSFNNHEASEDIDTDGYSEYETLRGTSWKGKDCNDLAPKIHPGFKPTGNDSLEDSNCNGIWGMDASGKPYEDTLCKGSQQLGLAVLGDSISAHFHIPEQWLDATQISEEVFQHIAFIIENELDWPQLSASTGHINNVWPVVQGNTSSLYLNLWQRNKCNFRDYQNVAVNGARSGAMLSDIVKTLSRKQNADQPLLVIYSLVGNDVCNGHPDTFNHMTKPDEMYANVLQTMQYLDTKLPNGSHVLLTGLANGSYLYALMSDRVHPIGRVKSDVLYKDVYTYLTCLQVSPCNGWLTTNDTERAMTTDYAALLSSVIRNVTVSYKFQNFDMAYLDFPFDTVIQKWVATGGEPWQLIEPIDGFHVNQYAHALVADTLWEFIGKNYPSWLGPVNPNNDMITKLFGDQGGY